MAKGDYAEKLKDPWWQKKRLEILQRDKFCCQCCFDNESTLHVHHKVYNNSDPWDIPNEHLITLCESCHQNETENIRKAVDSLIQASKRTFLCDDITRLSEIVSNMVILHSHDLVIATLKYWLTDENRMRMLVDAYFTYLEEKNKQAIDEFPR